MSEEDFKRFQIAVAIALARWQAVEFILLEFFIAAIDSPDPNWAAAAYNAIITFRGKLDMLHEILLHRLPSEELVREWKSLKQTLLDKSALRNKLVHWTFIATFVPDKGTFAYLSVPFGDARKGQAGKQLAESDLITMDREFTELQVVLRTYRERVKPLLTSPKKSSP